MGISFTIPGEPRGKMRPKASSFGGRARVYTPAKQVEYENWVRLCYELKAEETGFSPYGEGVPVCVFITAFYPIPKSVSKKKRAEMEEGKAYCLKKPDLDNVVKSVLDGLNGIAFKDDSQVVCISASKTYGREAFVHVSIYEDGE